MEGWLKSYPKRFVRTHEGIDPYSLNGDQLLLLMTSRLGWTWNVEEIGSDPSAIGCMIGFLETTLKEMTPG